MPLVRFTGLKSSKSFLNWESRPISSSSNFTFAGHKEDTLVKKISGRLAAKVRRNVVVTAGIHWDGITLKEIKTIENLSGKLSDRILEKLLPARKGRRR